MIFIGISLFIFLGLYMGWTKTGADIIDGVQGRYFIPILILPFLCLIQKGKYIKFKYINVIYISYLLLYTLYGILGFTTLELFP